MTDFEIPVRTTLRTAAFMPALSPPEVRTAILSMVEAGCVWLRLSLDEFGVVVSLLLTGIQCDRNFSGI